MKLRHSSALNVGDSQPPGATNQDHLRETQTETSKKCSQGALQLAAIVHYDSLASYCPAAAASQKNERSYSRARSAASSVSAEANNKSHVSLSTPDRLQETDRRCDTKSGEQQVVVLENNTHEESGGLAKKTKSSSSNNKFSRLFFTKNKSKQPPPAMIDNHDQDDSHAPPPPPSLKAREGHPGEESCSRSRSRSGAAAAAMSQVIEFKFDLIVEGEREETPKTDDDDNEEKLDNDELSGHSLAGATTTSRKILRPIQQRKLLDQVNELVESFVLDSMDVCLMTIGRGSSTTISSEGGPAPATFEYLLQSAELSVTYAFQLLAAVGPRGTTVTSSRRTLTPECSPLRVDEHSIELEALLFMEQAREPLQVVDLTGNFQRDCTSAQEALELIKQIEAQLSAQKSQTEFQQPSLMINLKLKQQVQGGLFTNRMCLLDLGERPRSSQLRPVLESIFSGQALAYLKAQKLRLHELELVAATSGTNTTDDSNDEPNKHHHHNASQLLEHLIKLSQAEWLVYKQLSSALIKSLMIVHCRRLASGSAHGDAENQKQVSSIEAHLMEYNLNLLEFASAIKRAAASRLKRRKRHLRSHLTNQTTGSNLSLASDTQNNYYKSHGSSPGADRLYHHHHRHQHDLMISSPFRHAKTVNRHQHHHRPCCGSPPAQLPVLPAHLIDRYNQSYTSHGRKHRNHRHHRHSRHQHHYHKHNEPDSGEGHKCSRHVHARAASLNRRRSHDLLGATSLSASSCRHCDELCETSSQMSTSSGSQRTSSSVRRRLVAEGRPMDDDLDDSLATTTLHSGTSLNVGQHQRNQGSGSTSIRGGGGCGTGAWPAGRGSSVASWAARARLQLQQRALDAQSSPSEQSAGGTLDDSIELQSFRSSSSGVTNPATLTRVAYLLSPRTEVGPPDDLIPNPPSPLEAESDLCTPVVAEPPRQLKLEQFLNQLTNAIGGPAPAALPFDQARRRGDPRDQDDEDDDEDCRSHSSILEHLSSLALESNMKMVKQQQQQQQQQNPASESRVSIVSNECAPNQTTSVRWPLENANGHLQRLLKSTLKLHHQSHQVPPRNPLTIDCGAHHSNASGPPIGPIGGTNLLDSKRHATDGFTPPTSIESGCSSSASSSSTSSGRHAIGGGGGSRGGLEQQKCVASKTAANLNPQLYTSVIKQNT